MTRGAADPARPLRALGALVALWIAGRAIAILAWPEALLIVPTPAATRMAAATSTSRDSATGIFRAEIAEVAEISKPLRDLRALRVKHMIMPAALPAATSQTTVCQPYESCDSASAPPSPMAAAEPGPPVTQFILPRARPILEPSPWSASAWLAVRDGSGGDLASGGQLGGSQAGFRVYRALTPALALTARGSGALSRPGAEGSAGIALRKGPVALLAERRFAIDRGGRNAWSLTAASGFSEVALPLDLRLDGYAQAGLVDRDAFADGALRIERTLSAAPDARLAIGAGIWGGIQPGVARLDIGPQLVARTALAGRPSRVSIEWRQRIAGNAAPGSGPVVTLGTDF